MARRVNPDGIDKQSVEDYLNSGGQITKCPAAHAIPFAPGTATIDGQTVAEYMGPQEIVSRSSLNAQSYTRALYDYDADPMIPMASHAWRDIEQESTRSYVPGIPSFTEDDE